MDGRGYSNSIIGDASNNAFLASPPSSSSSTSSSQHFELYENYFVPGAIPRPTEPLKEDNSKKNSKKRSTGEVSTAEVKLEKRNKQTRDASRLYRQRKKATEQNLAEQVAQLARENNAILEENNKLLPQIIELSLFSRMENEELKKGDDIISKEREMKKIELLRKLADILLRMKHHGTHAEIESELSQTLAQLLDPEGSFIQRQFPTTEDAIQIKGNLVDQLIKTKLFNTEKTEPLFNISAHYKASVLVSKINETIALTPEQQMRLDRLASEHELFMNTSNQRKKNISREFEAIISSQSDPISFFAQAGNQNDDSPASSIFKRLLNSASYIEQIKQLCDVEKEQWASTYNSILQTLSAIQLAQFILHIEYEAATVSRVKKFWQALTSQR